MGIEIAFYTKFYYVRRVVDVVVWVFIFYWFLTDVSIILIIYFAEVVGQQDPILGVINYIILTSVRNQ